jgi:hypothetical protein
MVKWALSIADYLQGYGFKLAVIVDLAYRCYFLLSKSLLPKALLLKVWVGYLKASQTQWAL